METSNNMDPHSSMGNHDEKRGIMSKLKSGPSTSDSAGYENVTITANDTGTAYANYTANELTTAYEGVITYEDVLSIDSSRAVQGSWESSSSERGDKNLDDTEQNIAKLLDGANPDHQGVCHDLEPTESFEKNVPLATEIEKINTDQLCDLIITGVLEGDRGSNVNSIDTLELEREMRKLTKGQKERIKETAFKLYDVSQKLMDLIGSQTSEDTEAFYWSSSILSRSYEASRGESENLQESPQQSAEKEHGKQFVKVPPKIEGKDLEVISPASDGQENPSVSTRQQKEEDKSSEKETTGCFNFRSICKCFRKWFSSSPLGRKDPDKGIQTPTQHATKKRSTRKNHKILPQ